MTIERSTKLKLSRRSFGQVAAIHGAGLALLATGCAPRDVGSPTGVPASRTNEPSSTAPATLANTPTPELATPGANYPGNENGFVMGAGGPSNAEERLRALGAGGDIDYMQSLINAEVRRAGEVNPRNLEWIFGLYENYPRASWTMMARDTQSGSFLWPLLTAGPDRGQLVRSGNLAQYLDRQVNEDFFDLLKLSSPDGLGQVEQSLLVDRSGWFIATARSARSGASYYWYDAENDRWQAFRDFIPRGATELRSVGDRLFALNSGGIPSHFFDKETQEWRVIPHEDGIIGPEPLRLGSIPASLTAPLETGMESGQRFVDANREPLQFGLYGFEEPYTYPPVDWKRPQIIGQYHLRLRGELPPRIFPADMPGLSSYRYFLFDIPGEFIDSSAGETILLGNNQFMVFRVARNIPGVQEPRPITIRRASGFNMGQVDSVGRAMDTNVFSDLLANQRAGTPIIITLIHYENSGDDMLQSTGREILEWRRREETRIIDSLINGIPVTSPIQYNINGAIIGR